MIEFGRADLLKEGIIEEGNGSVTDADLNAADIRQGTSAEISARFGIWREMIYFA